jgi:voltage-gated potassium channel
VTRTPRTPRKAAPPPQRPEGGSFRKTLQFYLIDCRTPLGKLIDLTLVVLNLLVCAIPVIETYPISAATHIFLWRLELVIVAFFICEYVARLYGAESRWRQLVDIYSIIDLVAIVPTLALLVLPLFGLSPDLAFLKLLRGLRVFRIFRFLRFTADPDFFFGQYTWRFLRVLRLFLTIFMLFFISSGLFYRVEHTTNPMINNFGDAFYFTVVALTTVGFGEIVPLSTGGRWLTVAMILTGIVLIPWQAGLIIKAWLRLGVKRDIICSNCGLRWHDRDASHCKSCGHVIYQVYEGDN